MSLPLSRRLAEGPVILGVRPTGFSSDGSPTLTVTPAIVEELGDDQPVSVGEPLTLSINPQRLHFFDTRSGAAL